MQIRLMIESTVVSDIVEAILLELSRAKTLYPSWPTNNVEATAIVAEEAGEALKEALNLRVTERPEKRASASYLNLRKELVQTAAMAIRALENL